MQMYGMCHLPQGTVTEKHFCTLNLQYIKEKLTLLFHL